MLSLYKNAVDDLFVVINVGVFYVGSDELDLAFEQLEPAAKIPNGVDHGDLKLVPY